MSGERVDWKLSWNTHDKWCIQNIGWLKYIGKDILSIEKWFAGTTCGHKFMFFYPRYPNIFWEDVLYLFWGSTYPLSRCLDVYRLIGALKFYLFSPRFVLKKLPAWGLLLYGSFVWGPWKDGRVKLDDRNGRRDSQGWVTYSLYIYIYRERENWYTHDKSMFIIYT